MSLPEVKVRAKQFEYDHDESFVGYRLRLRVLCELFALAGRPRTAREMFLLWRKGIKHTIWEDVANEVRFDAVKNRRLSDIEVIYALERIRVYTHGEPMLQEMTFVLKWEEKPNTVDFRTWNGIGPLYVYAHDELMDHSDWNEANARSHFYRIATYKRLLSTPPECHANEPDVVGMQMYLPSEQELSMMDLLRTANDEIPGETIGTVIAEDVGETADEEETEEEEEEEEEEDEGVEEQGGIPRSDRGNFRV